MQIRKHLTMGVLSILALIAVEKSVYGLVDSAYAGGIGVESDYGSSHLVGIVPAGFTLPPTAAMQQITIVKGNNGTLLDDRFLYEDTELQKFDLTAKDNDQTIVINGYDDLRKLPKSGIELVAGIEISTFGYWAVKDAEFPTFFGGWFAPIDMLTAAKWKPVDPNPDIYGAASSMIKDPFHYPALAEGETVSFSSQINSGQALYATGRGVASKQFFVGTDIPGYETLYQLDLEAKELNGTPTLSVEFSSHAGMGLDDATLVNMVQNAFSFDPIEQQFVLGSDLTIFDGHLPVPSGIPFDLYIDLSATAEVPAPIIQPPHGKTVILSPVAIEEEGLGADLGTPVTKMIDQSGFVEKFVSGETSFDDFVSNGLLVTSRSNNEFNFWSTPYRISGEPPQGELILDFGEPQTINGLAIWNLTLKQIGICVADLPDGLCSDVGNFTLAEKTGTESAVNPDVLQFDQDHVGRYLRIDVQSLYRPDENSAWFAVVNEIAAKVVRSDTGLLGDFNENDQLDVHDIDLLTAHLRDAGSDPRFDVNFDGNVDASDLDVWVRELKKTYFGDANLDLEFATSDLVEVFEAGKYEDDIAQNATWGEGDWDGNGDFDSSDLVKAFEDGGYERGQRPAAQAVPEPSAVVLLLTAAFTCVAAIRVTQRLPCARPGHAVEP